MTTNWAGNLTYSSVDVARPTSLEELADVVARSSRVRALGSRHSFNDVADTPGTHVVLDALDDGRPPVEVDAASGTVSVAAGLRYGDVTRHVQAAGRALANLASLPHISVAGSVATATHGSGDANRCLAAAVVGLELVTGDGEPRTLGADHPDLAGAVVGLGALGVVTRLTLATEPTFDVRQDVYTDLTWDALAENFDAITASAYSVSIFTDWGPDGAQQVWRKTRLAAGPPGATGGAVGPAGDGDGAGWFPETFFGARRAREARHPLPGIDPVHCTPQLGDAGPWNERLGHFRLDFTPSNGDELQTEYLVPRREALAAVEAMRGLGPRLSPLLQVGEIRTVAADDLWLSPFDEPTVALHLTWRPLPDDVARLLPALDDALAPLGGRPHWGKVFHGAGGIDGARGGASAGGGTGGSGDAAALAARYPRMGDFRALVQRYDPAGRFRGGYVERLLAG